MKRVDFEKTKRIGLSILIETGKILDEGVNLITFDDIKRNLQYMEGDSRRIQANIGSLEQRGYIKIDRKSDSIVLTKKGQIKIIENSDDSTVDGKWRMVSFDIPETLQVKRNQFRRSIKRIGYKKVQKSLWVCPFVKSDKVELIIRELGINSYVAFLLVEKTDIDNFLQALFKLELN
ncbi:MAG: hypothetical protein WC451_02470 [Patescibacteria group bacterium]